MSNQPTPTDIDYSLERYNLIRRTYWVNGQREKANSLPCQVEKPLGYIVLFAESGAVVSSFVVDGKEGLTSDDLLVRDMLKKVANKVIVAINKCDTKNIKETEYEFYELGFDKSVKVILILSYF